MGPTERNQVRDSELQDAEGFSDQQDQEPEARLVHEVDPPDEEEKDPLKGISTINLEKLILAKFKEMYSENGGNISFGVNKKEYQCLWEAVSEYIRIVRNSFRRAL